MASVSPAAAPWQATTTGAASSILPGSAPVAADGCGSRCCRWATGPAARRATATLHAGPLTWVRDEGVSHLRAQHPTPRRLGTRLEAPAPATAWRDDGAPPGSRQRDSGSRAEDIACRSVLERRLRPAVGSALETTLLLFRGCGPCLYRDAELSSSKCSRERRQLVIPLQSGFEQIPQERREAGRSVRTGQRPDQLYTDLVRHKGVTRHATAGAFVFGCWKRLHRRFLLVSRVPTPGCRYRGGSSSRRSQPIITFPKVTSTSTTNT
jgi:hypothetical protein